MQQLLKLIAKLAANCRLRDISHKGLLALLYPRRYPRWLWRLVWCMVLLRGRMCVAHDGEVPVNIFARYEM